MEPQDLVTSVKAAMKVLSVMFDKSRKTFQKPVWQESLSESSFVFALSASEQLIRKYTDMMCTNPLLGVSFGTVIVSSVKGDVRIPFSAMTVSPPATGWG